MAEMKTITFPDGNQYEIIDAKAREGLSTLQGDGEGSVTNIVAQYVDQSLAGYLPLLGGGYVVGHITMSTTPGTQTEVSATLLPNMLLITGEQSSRVMMSPMQFTLNNSNTTFIADTSYIKMELASTDYPTSSYASINISGDQVDIGNRMHFRPDSHEGQDSILTLDGNSTIEAKKIKTLGIFNYTSDNNAVTINHIAGDGSLTVNLPASFGDKTNAVQFDTLINTSYGIYSSGNAYFNKTYFNQNVENAATSYWYSPDTFTGPTIDETAATTKVDYQKIMTPAVETTTISQIGLPDNVITFFNNPDDGYTGIKIGEENPDSANPYMMWINYALYGQNPNKGTWSIDVVGNAFFRAIVTDTLATYDVLTIRGSINGQPKLSAAAEIELLEAQEETPPTWSIEETGTATFKDIKLGDEGTSLLQKIQELEAQIAALQA